MAESRRKLQVTELSTELRQEIIAAIRDGIRAAMEEEAAEEVEDLIEEEEAEDTFTTYRPPLTIAFRSDNLETLSDQINSWVLDSGNEVESIGTIFSTDKNGNRTYEALVVFYGDPSEPPLDNWRDNLD